MKNRKAIVTGGSSGIGRGVVYCLAAAGYDVVFSYNSQSEKAMQVLENLRAEYPQAYFACFGCDLSTKGEGTAFFHRAVEALGGLDLLVNNAGVTLKESIFDLTEESMDYMLNLDFRNYMLLMRESCTWFASHGVKGNVINITSTRADRAYPTDAVYGAIKAGINRATQSVALDVAPYGIRVNNIAPGAIRRITDEEMEQNPDHPQVVQIHYLSPRIPLERYGLPEDIGHAVVFLASEEASYITGTTLKIEGGLTLPGMPERPEGQAKGWGAPKRIWNVSEGEGEKDV